jgi:hypothetical protein
MRPTPNRLYSLIPLAAAITLTLATGATRAVTGEPVDSPCKKDPKSSSCHAWRASNEFEAARIHGPVEANSARPDVPAHHFQTQHAGEAPKANSDQHPEDSGAHDND